MSNDLPLQDVVQQVLEAEQRSKSIVSQAEAEAERITGEARRTAQELVQKARRETAEQGFAMVRQAEQEAERRRKERLAQAAADIETAIELNEQAAQAAEDAVLRCVCGGS